MNAINKDQISIKGPMKVIWKHPNKDGVWYVANFLRRNKIEQLSQTNGIFMA